MSRNKKGSVVVKYRSTKTYNKEPWMDPRILFSFSKVYVGIDVHRKTFSIAVWIDGQIDKKATMPANHQKLLKSLRSWYPNRDIQTAYEAGFCGFGLHRFLVQNGIKNIVVKAASI